jgi:hypothetical protein
MGPVDGCSCASVAHAYEVRPRKDKRGVNLISDALPFGRLFYAGPNAMSNAIGYAMQSSRSHDAVIRIYDAGQHDRNVRARAISGAVTRETNSRHTVKRDG